MPLPLSEHKPSHTHPESGVGSPASPSAYPAPGSTASNRFVGIGSRDNFLNIPQQTQSWFL